VSEAAHLPVGLRRFDEVEVGECVGLGRLRRNAEALEQVLADEVRRLASGVADPEVDAWLAEVDRQQLRVAVREVQQVHVAEARQFIHLGGCGRSGQRIARRDRQARGGSYRQHLKELATVHRHLFSPSS
jgi:hypothetical protein